MFSFKTETILDNISKFNYNFRYINPLIANNTIEMNSKIISLLTNIINLTNIYHPKYFLIRLKSSYYGLLPLCLSNLSDKNDCFINQINNYIKKKNKDGLDKYLNINKNILNDKFISIQDYFFKNNNIPKFIRPIYSFFTPNNILRDIECNIKNGIEINFEFKKIQVKLRVIDYKKIKLDNFFIKNIIFKIRCLILLSKKKSGILKITIFLSNIDKKFTDGDYLGVMNINNAFTIHKSKNLLGEIYIFRLEECEKVLIHELIHALSIDFFYQDSKNINEIMGYFDISDKNFINLFEAYTETWALYLNIICNSIIYKFDLEIINYYLHLEVIFNLIQVSKILVYFGYDNFDKCDFFCKSKFIKKKKKFNQGTSILAYFIFKLIIIYNFDRFLDFCIEYNDNDTPWIFNTTDTNLFNFILEQLNKSNIITLINSFINLLKKDKKKLINNNNITFNTLKMSLIEYDLN